MNVIFIVPTGLGAPIGGHAGDATPAARLLDPIVKKSAFGQLKVKNYMEAAGMLLAIREGIAFGSLRRPMKATEIFAEFRSP